MIITSPCCEKKFEVAENLIPEKGRLVECSSCNHQWFFKLETKKNISKTPEINIDRKTEEKEKIIEKEAKLNDEETIDDDDYNIDSNIKTNNKNVKFHNIIIVFIISFVAFIIFIDTFKYPISKIIPNIEFILYNLYESVKDIKLFFNDLI